MSAPQFSPTPPPVRRSRRGLWLSLLGLVAVLAVVLAVVTVVQNKSILVVDRNSSGVSKEDKKRQFKIPPARAKLATEAYSKVLKAPLNTEGQRQDLGAGGTSNGALYGLADLDGDREPELLVFSTDSSGKTWMDIWTAPVKEGGGAVSVGSYGWSDISPQDLASGLHTPSVASASTGVRVPSTPVYADKLGKLTGSPADALFIILKGLTLLAQSEPHKAPVAEAGATASADDYNDIAVPTASLDDTTILDNVVAGADDTVVDNGTADLAELWEYQLTHLKDLSLPEGVRHAQEGRSALWSTEGYEVKDINEDGYPELIVRVLEMGSSGAAVNSAIVFTYDPATAQAYVSLVQLVDELSGSWEGSNQWGLVVKKDSSTSSADEKVLLTLQDHKISPSDIRGPVNSSDPKLQATDDSISFDGQPSKLPANAATGIRIRHYLALATENGFDESTVQTSSPTTTPTATTITTTATAVATDWEAQKAKAEASGLSFFHGVVHLVGWSEAQSINPYDLGTTSVGAASSNSKTFVVLISKQKQTLNLGNNGSLGSGSMLTNQFHTVYIWPAGAVAEFKPFEGQEVGVTFNPSDAHIPQSVDTLPTSGLLVSAYTDIVS